jgi:cytosine/adenosine deaminase-related metal-dependent hydrolase
MSELRTFSARWVFPVSGPPLERGVVAIRGDRIESVHPHGERTADVDLGNAAVVPGFVNAHTHLDLSGARGLVPPTDPDHFTDWLRGVIAFRRGRTPEQVQTDIRAGLEECLRSGTTLIGDISAGGASWTALLEAKLRSFVFWELIGLNETGFESALARCREASADLPSDLRWGPSPHAPYSVNHVAAIALLANQPGPVSIHLAESPGEMELLHSRTGPFVTFLKELGVWDPAAISRTAQNFLHQPDDSRSPRLFIHCNDLPPETPFAPNQSVVYCPRTHAAFAHPPHPFREFLRRDVRVCLGTDSLASNPDLDIFAEARFVHEQHPDLPGDQLLRMITLSGAEALGRENETGSLEPGKAADMVCMELPDRDGHAYELFFAADGDRRTMFAGEWR